jgi:hypothetical protein
MPGALEATEGLAPEITIHAESALTSGGDLSPEERAISGVAEGQTSERGGDEDDAGRDDADATALAEGAATPPGGEQA